MEPSPIPAEVLDVLKSNSIGYLTTISKSGELYSYPVAFYYSDLRVYFVTPVSAAKYKMIRENPTVSLIVDNRQLTLSACGAMIQGRARIFSITRTILSILSVGPKVAAFSKKYPGMLGFYAKGKGLPDERKLYKYRVIQIDPTKILYWIGYSFGRYLPKREKKLGAKLGLKKDDENSAALSGLLRSADDELPSLKSSMDHDWLAKLDDAFSTGRLTDEERALISSYKLSGSATRPGLSKDEKQLLTRWKHEK